VSDNYSSTNAVFRVPPVQEERYVNTRSRELGSDWFPNHSSQGAFLEISLYPTLDALGLLSYTHLDASHTEWRCHDVTIYSHHIAEMSIAM
jgi:hypothetical protein